MTPQNIINQALKKKIDVISITDHNSNQNVKSAIKMAEDKDITIIPGIEVESKEEIHLLCYFDSCKKLDQFSKIIYDSLDKIENDEDIFGYQIIVNHKDQFQRKEEKLLANSSKYSIDKIISLTKRFNGINIISHADRSYGIIKNLGFIPQNLDLQFIEMSFSKTIDQYYNIYPYLKEYTIVKNSDSHSLSQIKPIIKIVSNKKPRYKEVFYKLKEMKDISRFIE